MEGSPKCVSKVCPSCHNQGEFVLCYAKTGMGVGIPIASLFTDKAILAKKTFVLACPVCPYNEKISRDAAAALKTRSQPA